MYGTHSRHAYALLPRGLLQALVDVIQRDSSSDNRVVAVSCLANMAMNSGDGAMGDANGGGDVMGDASAVAAVVDVVREQGADAARWVRGVR